MKEQIQMTDDEILSNLNKLLEVTKSRVGRQDKVDVILKVIAYCNATPSEIQFMSKYIRYRYGKTREQPQFTGDVSAYDAATVAKLKAFRLSAV